VKTLAIVHQPDAGPGVFAEAAAAAGHELVEWMPPAAPPPELDGVGAAMVFGGAMHVDQEEANPWLRGEKEFLRRLLSQRVPVLGICLGAQLLAEAAGGAPRRARQPEIGWHGVELDSGADGDPLLGPLPDSFESFQWHSYEAPLPPGATPLARSEVCLQAYRLDGRSWGLQFHAEVTRDSVERWLRNYRNDDDAVRIGIDPDGIRAESERRIEAWNEVGRGICARFLEMGQGSATRG
jgi:GMP synthase (glutamine-hydrolysing)